VDHSDKLKQTLSELHAELAGARKVDPATRKLLADALADIQEALAAAESASADERPTPPEGIAERLQSAATKFETTHPTLAGLLERLTDLLSAAGI
jgi:ABC-type transporter Mla subunit MlaD